MHLSALKLQSWAHLPGSSPIELNGTHFWSDMHRFCCSFISLKGFPYKYYWILAQNNPTANSYLVFIPCKAVGNMYESASCCQTSSPSSLVLLTDSHVPRSRAELFPSPGIWDPLTRDVKDSTWDMTATVPINPI